LPPSSYSSRLGTESLDFTVVASSADLAEALGQLRRRQALRDQVPQLSIRDLAKVTGYSRGSIGAYFTGTTLPPPERLDVLADVLGASLAERRELAEARDLLAELRRPGRIVPGAADTVASVAVIWRTTGTPNIVSAVSWAAVPAAEPSDEVIYLGPRGGFARSSVPPGNAVAVLVVRLGG